MSKNVNNNSYAMAERCQAFENAFTFDPLFPFERTPTEGSATSSSFPAPSETLHLMYQDQLQHWPKINFGLNCLGEAHFDLLHLHRCLYHPRRMQVQ